MENRESCYFRKTGQGRPLKEVTLKQRPTIIYTETVLSLRAPIDLVPNPHFTDEEVEVARVRLWLKTIQLGNLIAIQNAEVFFSRVTGSSYLESNLWLARGAFVSKET